MVRTSREIIQKTLDQAFETALPVFRARLQDLPGEAQEKALQSAEGIRNCLEELAFSRGASSVAHENLVRLIFTHADPRVASALRDFAELVNFFLMDARDELQQPGSKTSN